MEWEEKGDEEEWDGKGSRTHNSSCFFQQLCVVSLLLPTFGLSFIVVVVFVFSARVCVIFERLCSFCCYCCCCTPKTWKLDHIKRNILSIHPQKCMLSVVGSCWSRIGKLKEYRIDVERVEVDPGRSSPAINNKWSSSSMSEEAVLSWA